MMSLHMCPDKKESAMDRKINRATCIQDGEGGWEGEPSEQREGNSICPQSVCPGPRNARGKPTWPELLGGSGDGCSTKKHTQQHASEDAFPANHSFLICKVGRVMLSTETLIRFQGRKMEISTQGQQCARIISATLLHRNASPIFLGGGWSTLL